MADTRVNIKIENIVEAFKMMVQFVYMGARTIVKKKTQMWRKWPLLDLVRRKMVHFGGEIQSSINQVKTGNKLA